MDTESSSLVLKEMIQTASEQNTPVKKDLLLFETVRIGAKNSVRNPENFVRHGKTTDTVPRSITSSFRKNLNGPFEK